MFHVFQSTLPYGSDYRCNGKSLPVSWFQSTLPYGSDYLLMSTRPYILSISIHAPLRERPYKRTELNIHRRKFQSTLPYGSDVLPLLLLLIMLEFQSTLPYGSDRPEFLGSHSSMIFQSTLPYGSDTSLSNTKTKPEGFQSTLPYGSDLKTSIRWNYTKISIHAPLRERPGMLIKITNLNKFQSTLPYGSECCSLCD